ncbi:LysR family transcriptional regulator [Polymorphum gilvum]|uniref:Transcription factor transcription regulator protein n=1 Tax=Polymorphum gilvum (strain LMG 25793 / CGMCC 1.9160 / SL003B-26A1) TaxID=991905 RepID=F2IWY4_POLGS|nr:LysR family transcriptional regulator [Polymorphum gilvum]ADZ71561.1 Transcription factor transcription regulator protein [Polymorphum gilvum SL003B-26A1]
MINPKHLRAFVAVAQTGTVVRSSRVVRRAQSAVTRSIRELERDLGVTLFERRPLGMLLTEFGHALLKRVDRAFAEMNAAKQGFASVCGPSGWNDHASVFTLSMSRQRLVAYIELIENQHMGVVADHLGISQPAVSQALREFEVGLGVNLVTRTPTGIKPTALGSLLAVHIRRALSEIRAAEAEVSALNGAISGDVTVGTLSLGRTRLLPRAIIQLTESYPNLSVRTVEGSFDHLSTLLRGGDIDFILGALRPPEHVIGLVGETITHDVLALVVRQGHPLSRRKTLQPADLLDVAWVLPQPGAPTRDLLETALRIRGLGAPSVTVQTADLAITRGLLLESDMVTAVSTHLFQREIDAGDLVVLPLDLPETRRGIGILQRATSSPSIAARLLMENLKAIGRL